MRSSSCGWLDPRRSSLNSSHKPNKGRQANNPTAHPCDWRHRHGRNRNDPAPGQSRTPRPRPGARPREGDEARPKVELVVGDLDHPASLKPAFASVDEAFVVVNGKDLNRLDANTLDRSRAFKRLRLRWRQRERGVPEDVRTSILGKWSREYICLSGVGGHSRRLPHGTCSRIEG